MKEDSEVKEVKTAEDYWAEYSRPNHSGARIVTEANFKQAIREASLRTQQLQEENAELAEASRQVSIMYEQQQGESAEKINAWIGESVTREKTINALQAENAELKKENESLKKKLSDAFVDKCCEKRMDLQVENTNLTEALRNIVILSKYEGSVSDKTISLVSIKDIAEKAINPDKK